MTLSRQKFSNESLLAKIGFDTAENEPSKVCQELGSWIDRGRPNVGLPRPGELSCSPGRWAPSGATARSSTRAAATCKPFSRRVKDFRCPVSLRPTPTFSPAPHLSNAQDFFYFFRIFRFSISKASIISQSTFSMNRSHRSRRVQQGSYVPLIYHVLKGDTW